MKEVGNFFAQRPDSSSGSDSESLENLAFVKVQLLEGMYEGEMKNELPHGKGTLIYKVLLSFTFYKLRKILEWRSVHWWVE